MEKNVEKKTIKGEIISNHRIARDHFEMQIENPWLSRKACPGQFVMVKVQENTSDPLLRIPMGIHSSDGKSINLLYKVVGKGTELLSLKRKGEIIDVLGPLGNGFNVKLLLQRKWTKALIVAGGHGIAPMYMLVKDIVARKRKAEVFVGAGTKEHIICVEKLEKLGAKVYIATEDGTRGYKGYVTSLVRKHLKSEIDERKMQHIIYACGPRPMLAALSRYAEALKITAQVSLDEYMACGIGVCRGCAVKTGDGYKLVCKDGPVFYAGEIKWEAG